MWSSVLVLFGLVAASDALHVHARRGATHAHPTLDRHAPHVHAKTRLAPKPPPPRAAARHTRAMCAADDDAPVIEATATPTALSTTTETPARSLVKAAGWRFTAGIVTAISSFVFTGSLATAASIVGWDLISKSGTMFLGERLWNKVQWGKSDTAGGGDTSKRSLAKALAWRAFAACNTLFASIVLTKGKAGVASKIAGADTVVKTVLFYFYERAWSVIPWGKSAA